MKKHLLNLMYPIFVLLFILLIWTIYAYTKKIELICPTPKNVFKEILNYISEKNFYIDLKNTLIRATISFILSFIIAFAMAILSKMNNVIRKLCFPFLGFIRGLPTMSILLILAYSTSAEERPIIVSLIVLLPLLYSTILGALDTVSNDIIEMASIYHIKKKDIIFKIYSKEIAKPLIEGMASSASFNLKLIISAEAISYTLYSLGKEMSVEKINYETSRLFALTIIVVLLGLLIEMLIRKIGLYFVRWDNDRN
jgi:NitT/TauT family transport system permease protein